MSEIDIVQQHLGGYFNHLAGPCYVRIMDTPRIWGPVSPAILPQARQRQQEFERSLVEIVQRARYRCDISSLNCPDPDWGRVILGAIDTALTTRMGRDRPTQFRFLFGQTPLNAVTDPVNYVDFKAGLVRLIGARSSSWEQPPEVWIGRFYRLAGGIADALMQLTHADAIFDSDDTKMTWNHSKIVAVDGSQALVGGHNLNMDLFRSYPPVHDVSVVMHGEAAYGAQLFLNRMWACGTDLLTKERLDPAKRTLQTTSTAGIPADPLTTPDATIYVRDRCAELVNLHRSNTQSGTDPPAGAARSDPANDLQTLTDLAAPVLPERPVYGRYDKFEEYRAATRVLSVGKYWTGSDLAKDYQRGSEVMKQQLISNAKRVIKMSQMDLISAWKKRWSDHVVCQWLMAALLANKNLTVQVVVSPLDAGAGAEGDQYSFGSGAQRTYDLIKYYMTHDADTDAPLADPGGARVEALTRIAVAPLYFTERVPPDRTTEGQTYTWPGLSPEGYTATLKQAPLSQDPPKKGIIGSAITAVAGASGYVWKKVPSAPGNHAKITIVDDEAYVVGSDNLYPGSLSEFNYLIEGVDAVQAMLDTYWRPLWTYAGPHAIPVPRPPGPVPQQLTLVRAAASSELTAAYNGKPQTADRLLENADATFWNSDDKGRDPRPWFWVELSAASVVSELKIRWKSAPGSTGARAMKYRVLRSLDGITWSDTGRSQADVANLTPNLDIDRLAGWADRTKFVRVEMSDSSYGPNAYFTCHGVEVWGT